MVRRVMGMLHGMDILGYTGDAVDLRFSRTEAQALYNLLVETESRPFEAVGPRPFIRQIRERVSSAIEGFSEQGRPGA